MIQKPILIHNLWITAVDNDVKNSLLVDKKENFRRHIVRIIKRERQKNN